MSKNPLINSFAALIYIILVVTVMTLAIQPLKDKPDTIFAPIAVLSLLTLSVSVMAYLFFYQPVLMFVEGKKKEAIDLFFKTIAIFASFTGVSLILLLLLAML